MSLSPPHGIDGDPHAFHARALECSAANPKHNPLHKQLTGRECQAREMLISCFIPAGISPG